MAVADGVTHPALSHVGAWTEDAYLALPDDRRIELIDGSLLVGPTTDERHEHAVAVVRAAVQAVLPEGLQVLGPVALRLSHGRILVPDLVVAATDEPDEPGTDSAAPDGVRDSAVALVVIDVVGRGNGVADRWFKPQLYAGSRIPYALLIDRDDPFAVGNMLIGGRYHEFAAAEGDEVLRLEEPFPLHLRLADLAPPPAPVSPEVPGAAQELDPLPAEPAILRPRDAELPAAGTPAEAGAEPRP